MEREKMSEEKINGFRSAPEPITAHMFEPPVEHKESRCSRHNEVRYPHVGCLSCYVEILQAEKASGDDDESKKSRATTNKRTGIQVF